VARRKAARAGHARSRRSPAQAVGAGLVAIALLLGVSLVPEQTAVVPRYLAARAGQAAGSAAPALPILCFLAGLSMYVEATFRLGTRLWGLVAGYAVALVALHLRYPAGREWLAASGRKGGGYVGAALEVALRRVVGEPGLWTAVALGALASGLLLSGISAGDALRALLRAARAAAAACAAAVPALIRATAASSRAALRAFGWTLARAGRLCAGAGRAWRASAREIAGRVASLSGTRGTPAGTQATSGAMPDVAPLAAAQAPPAAAGIEVSGPRAEPEARDATAAAGEVGAVPASVVREDDADAGQGAAEPVAVGAGRAASPAREGAAGSANGRPRRRKPLAAQEPLTLPLEPSRAYSLPELSLLDTFPPGKARSGKVDPDEVARNLEKTLASFGVDARVVRWETGPVVTRYELQPAPGVKVQKITSLQNDIALALAASSVRLEAPIPGKSAIGVELPNERPGLVHLREILASEEFRGSPSPLTVAVGKGIAGTPVVADLVTMPHLLIAGATGAGKSVAINSMIASILFRATPEQVRFLLIDPKRVELTNYNGIPHLLSPVVTGPREAASKLRWAIQEMESRYEMFARDGVRNIQSFNAQHPDRPLAYILIIIDELADLMMIAPADFEEIICRLAQMTRATGIHLLVATQRPSVDVITGLIKANIPSRIAFSVSSQVDSRTILDHPGAEKLLGRGDMLFAPIGATRPTRVQGAFISDAETERLVKFWRAQGEPAYVESLVRAGAEGEPEEASADDALLQDAARLVVRAGYASVSLLQRKMRIGYVRAARVVDQLEEKGIVGPAQGSSPRDVLVGLDELERLLRAAPGGRPARPAEPEPAEDGG